MMRFSAYPPMGNLWRDGRAAGRRWRKDLELQKLHTSIMALTRSTTDALATERVFGRYRLSFRVSRSAWHGPDSGDGLAAISARTSNATGSPPSCRTRSSRELEDWKPDLSLQAEGWRGTHARHHKTVIRSSQFYHVSIDGPTSANTVASSSSFALRSQRAEPSSGCLFVRLMCIRMSRLLRSSVPQFRHLPFSNDTSIQCSGSPILLRARSRVNASPRRRTSPRRRAVSESPSLSGSFR